MRPTLPFALVSFAVGLAAAAQDASQGAPQDADQPEAANYVDVVPVSRVNPDYPEASLRQGKEGWVELSFVISETGDVVEPMIEQSSGGAPFESAAINAVAKWKYAPAMQDGVPVERATKTIIRFQLQGGSGFASGQGRGNYVERASAAFVKNYQQLVRLVDAQDFQRAAELLTEMEAEERINRYETAFLWWAKYVYLSRTSPSDAAQLRRALERAVGSDEEDMYLSMDQFVAAAERLVVLHAQAADIAAAIATFERLRDAVAQFGQDPANARLRAVEAYTQSVAGLTPGYDAMLELVASDKLMAMNGAVGEFDYWVHDLLRPSFSFADINGRLESLDVRCERGRRRYDSIPVGTVWRVPEKWGACGVYLKGEPGTTFAFREYPPSFAAPDAVDVGAR